MNSNPPGPPNGNPPRAKTNPLRPLRKKPRPNPLVARKPGQKPPVKPGSSAASSSSQTGAKPSLDELRRQYGGWSEPPPQYEFKDIPIMTTKKALLDGIRYHLMKLAAPRTDDPPIDPTDQDEFTRPVTLHRRDARQPPPGRTVKVEQPDRPMPDDQEKERIERIKAEKEAQRAVDQAKIAPVAKDAVPKRPKKQKEEKTVFNRGPRTSAAKKESDLRYEEALPWHLEDVDGKNVWVGTYVAALSEATVAFMIDNAVFRMIPLEKWYKFNSKPPFQAMTIDQAEELMGRKVDAGRWVMKDEEKRSGQAELEATRRMLSGHGQMIKTESDTFKAASRAEKMEHDELDISGDEFQDDDETPTFEKNDDEDTKESKDRIRREQLGANLFGDGDEQEVDKDLHEQLREELERQHFGKATKKALIKRDREDQYESDNSEDNPWSSSSDDDSSDDEDAEKDEDKKDQDKKDPDADKNGNKSASSKGSTTPQGKQRHDVKPGKSLKRAGSPALSESSGNESSRKKMKKAASSTGSRAGTPMGQAARRPKVSGAGSGSDGETTAAEMSDGAVRKRKIKIVNSNRGTPTASRAGSPVPPSGSQSAPIEPKEILDRIPPEGIEIGELIKPFKARLGEGPGQMPKKEWIKLVTQLCEMGPNKKLRKKKDAA